MGELSRLCRLLVARELSSELKTGVLNRQASLTLALHSAEVLERYSAVAF